MLQPVLCSSFTEILPSHFDFFSRPLFQPCLLPVLWRFIFSPPDCLPSRPSSPLHFPFFHPFLLTSLKFWATLRRAYWHRLVVDDFFAVITHMHARTCWSGSRVDEQCQPRSSFGERSCSRKCIRPPGRSVSLP